MSHTRAVVLPLVVGLSMAASGVAQEMQMPKPGPEHQIFKTDEGTWDATVEIGAAPGTPAMTSTGVETNVVGCNGLCLITDFKGQMGGSPFTGHGVAAYDAVKKKYVGSWTDSMSRGIATSESTYDPATKTTIGWMETPDPMTGAPMKSKSVVEYADGDHRIFTLYMVAPDGKEMQTMRIKYVRRK